jgi:hypothetical protein
MQFGQDTVVCVYVVVYVVLIALEMHVKDISILSVYVISHVGSGPCSCDQEGHVRKGLGALPGFGWFSFLKVYGCGWQQNLPFKWHETLTPLIVPCRPVGTSAWQHPAAVISFP